MSLMKTVSMAGLGSSSSKPLKSEGVGSAPELLGLRGRTGWNTGRWNIGQTRQIEHLRPLRLARRKRQRAAFISSALWSLVEKIGHEWTERTLQRTGDINTRVASAHTHPQALLRRWSRDCKTKNFTRNKFTSRSSRVFT